MKKIILSLSALLLAAMLMVSCNKNTPKEVATTWLTSFYHMDYAAAQKVSTEDTKIFLANLIELSGQIDDSSKVEMKKVTVTVKGAKDKNDTLSVVTYEESGMPGKEQVLTMVKQNGKWLAQFSKDDNMSAETPDGPVPNLQPAVGADSSAPVIPPTDSAVLEKTNK